MNHIHPLSRLVWLARYTDLERSELSAPPRRVEPQQRNIGHALAVRAAELGPKLPRPLDVPGLSTRRHEDGLNESRQRRLPRGRVEHNLVVPAFPRACF